MSIDRDCSASNGAEVVRLRELFIKTCALMDKDRVENEKLMARNEFKQQHKVAVSVGVYDVYNLDTMTAHPLPAKALKFRNRFDNGLDVAPCSLEVDF